MSRTIVFALGAAAALAGVTPAGAAFVVIDDFTSTQTVQVSSGGPNPVGVFAGANTGGATLGGSRLLEIQRDSGSGSVFAGCDFPTPGVLTFASFPDTAAFVNLVWDGDTNSALDFSNFSADLTGGGSNTSVQITYRYDLTITGSLFLWNSLAKYSRIDFAFTGASGFGATPFNVLNLPFAGLTPVGGGVDLSAVNAVSLQLNTLPFGPVAAADFELGDISAVPGPGALSVWLGAALVSVRRRRLGT